MASADYYSCDVCGGKTFYDANLYWQNGTKETDWRDFLHGVGDMAVICGKCSKEYQVKIMPKNNR
jgi:hypothetical protein